MSIPNSMWAIWDWEEGAFLQQQDWRGEEDTNTTTERTSIPYLTRRLDPESYP